VVRESGVPRVSRGTPGDRGIWAWSGAGPVRSHDWLAGHAAWPACPACHCRGLRVGDPGPGHLSRAWQWIIISGFSLGSLVPWLSGDPWGTRGLWTRALGVLGVRPVPGSALHALLPVWQVARHDKSRSSACSAFYRYPGDRVIPGSGISGSGYPFPVTGFGTGGSSWFGSVLVTVLPAAVVSWLFGVWRCRLRRRPQTGGFGRGPEPSRFGTFWLGMIVGRPRPWFRRLAWLSTV